MNEQLLNCMGEWKVSVQHMVYPYDQNCLNLLHGV